MSRIRLRHDDQEIAGRLQNQLIQEFTHPSEEYVQPFINIEQPGDRTHLLVIWDDWRNLSQQERSHLVMEAYQAAEGAEAANRVSVAMGLTQEEAERLGFNFEPA